MSVNTVTISLCKYNELIKFKEQTIADENKSKILTISTWGNFGYRETRKYYTESEALCKLIQENDILKYEINDLKLTIEKIEKIEKLSIWQLIKNKINL